MELVESMLGADYLAGGDAGATPNLPAIRAATDTFLARFPPTALAEYRISVYREGELLRVIFLDKERPPGVRGSGGRPGCPGFEVTLEEESLSVVDAHFVK
jgi:hypothetical protein